MLVVDTKKNVYDVRFYTNNGAEWSEDFFNVEPMELVRLPKYSTIANIIEYMNDYLNKIGEFANSEVDVSKAYYNIRYMYTIQ